MSQSLDFEGFGQTAQPGISLPSYLAFVCRPPDPPQARYLGEASLIDTLVSRWREAAFASPGDVEAQTAAGTALRKAIWDPVSPLLGEEDRVFVIPDGFLNQINLDALPDPGGGFLAETMPLFCYLPVERDVAPASAKEGPSRESNDTGGLLVLGGADYWYADAADTEPSTGSSVRGDAVLFAGLPGAEAEAKDIADLWASRAPDPHARVVVLTGREAGEAAFKRNVRGRKVIHLATHAFFNRPEQAWRSPLESSGLALAGANLLPVTGERKEDGILYADEVAVLDLSGVDWVVLSACETALGAIRAREGVLGLRRAFQVAGARTLIMSLWSVEDGATRKWMHTLYAGRLSGMSTAAALREANLDAIRSLRGGDKSRVSARWGAFVAVGHWR
jgi:CHAT domain-containing protein